MILKFGKYKDYPIEDVPTDYIEYLIKKNEEQTLEYYKELKRRDQEGRNASRSN